MDFLKSDREFKEALGAFIIASSEMEFAITSLCSILGEDPRFHQKQLLDIFGKTLGEKRKLVGKFIKTHLPELKDEWININGEIDQINADRRHLAHGFTQYFLPQEHIETYVKNKNNGKVEKKKFTSGDIKALTNKIHHINTGENGINGVFHTKLFVARINLWNEQVESARRMIYSVSDVILTDWKGSN
jgi:hypothetical protein